MPTFTDARGLEVTCASAAAAAAHDGMTDAYVGFLADTGDRLRAAMKADPDAPMIQAQAGYVFHLMALKPLMERAEAASAKASALAAEIGNPREKLHAEALANWTRGDLRGAVDSFERLLLDYPEDILALKLAHYLHFYLGDIAEHRDSIARVLPAWREEMPGYSAVLGMRAFGLEEAGEYEAAERFGRRAVDLNPADTWSIHAVAHVLEMQGRHREGAAWIDRDVAHWDDKVHNFAFHVWWHKALFHLELGETDTVLNLYDARIRAEETTDGLDIANAAALLMRLKLLGVDCGDRWAPLAETVAGRVDERLIPFNDLHYMLALAGAGDARANAAAETIADHGEGFADYWASVYREIAGPMARGIAAYGAGKYQKAVSELMPVRYRWGLIGGSHAQRDVFQQVLIDAARQAGDWRLSQALLRERTSLRPNSRDAWRRLSEAASALGQNDAARTAERQAARLAAA